MLLGSRLLYAHLDVILPSFLQVVALAQTCPWTQGKYRLTKHEDYWSGRQYQHVPTLSILFHPRLLVHFPTSSSALALAAASACFCSSMDEQKLTWWIFLSPHQTLQTCLWYASFLKANRSLCCESALKSRQTFHLHPPGLQLITTACPWTAVTKSRSKRFLFEMSPMYSFVFPCSFTLR